MKALREPSLGVHIHMTRILPAEVVKFEPIYLGEVLSDGVNWDNFLFIFYFFHILTHKVK